MAETVQLGSIPYPAPRARHDEVRLAASGPVERHFPLQQAYRVRSAEGEIWAEGEAALVCYDPDTMESAEIPADLRDALEAMKG